MDFNFSALEASAGQVNWTLVGGILALPAVGFIVLLVWSAWANGENEKAASLHEHCNTRNTQLREENELLKKQVTELQHKLDADSLAFNKRVDEALQEVKGLVYEKTLPVSKQPDRLYYFDSKSGFVVSIPKSNYNK